MEVKIKVEYELSQNFGYMKEIDFLIEKAMNYIGAKEYASGCSPIKNIRDFGFIINLTGRDEEEN